MNSRVEAQGTDTFNHLRGQTICGRTLQTVLDAGVAERLQVHVGERRGTTGDAHRNPHMRGIDLLDERYTGEQVDESLALARGEGVHVLTDQHPLGHGHRSVRNRALDVDAGGRPTEQGLVSRQIPACGKRYEHLRIVGECSGHWSKYILDLIWFDCHDHHVGGRDDLLRGVHGSAAHCRDVAFQLVEMRGACHNVVPVDRMRTGQSLCDCLCHVAVANETNLHTTLLTVSDMPILYTTCGKTRC